MQAFPLTDVIEKVSLKMALNNILAFANILKFDMLICHYRKQSI